MGRATEGRRLLGAENGPGAPGEREAYRKTALAAADKVDLLVDGAGEVNKEKLYREADSPALVWNMRWAGGWMRKRQV